MATPVEVGAVEALGLFGPAGGVAAAG